MSAVRENGGHAFPTEPNTQPGFYIHHGMSLRDWFAGQAIGLGFDWVSVHETGGYAEAAQVAYEIADAMLAAREAKP